MAEQHNSLLCTFDPTSPCITAFDINEWIHEALKIPEHKAQMIQINSMCFGCNIYADSLLCWGTEGLLLRPRCIGLGEGPYPHFCSILFLFSLMLQGGVFVGLVTLVLAVGKLDITFTDETAWEMCVGLEF